MIAISAIRGAARILSKTFGLASAPAEPAADFETWWAERVFVRDHALCARRDLWADYAAYMIERRAERLDVFAFRQELGRKGLSFGGLDGEGRILLRGGRLVCAVRDAVRQEPLIDWTRRRGFRAHAVRSARELVG